jgi:hypothetical protein
MATAAKRSRQARALIMLESQLASGVKTEKGTRDNKVELTDSDKKRLNKEIGVLQGRP